MTIRAASTPRPWLPSASAALLIAFSGCSSDGRPNAGNTAGATAAGGSGAHALGGGGTTSVELSGGTGGNVAASGAAGVAGRGGSAPSFGGSSQAGASAAAGQGGTSSVGGTSASGGTAGAGAAGGGTAGAGAAGGGTAGGGAAGGTAAGGGTAGGTGGGGAQGTAGGGASGQGGKGLEGLPAPSAVLTAMRSANDHFKAKWPDPTIDIVTDRARPSNLWTRAVYYEGLMALHAVETDAARKQSYYDYAVRWGESPAHPWQLTYGSAADTNADDQACGQVYIDLYRIDPQPERILQIQTSIDRMVSQRITNVWTWIDAIQMAMPVFAKLGVLRNDPRYFDAMWALYADSRNLQGGGLFNEAAGLWWRDANFNPGGVYTRSPNGQDIYWSRGNGWVFAALVRVLEVLPQTDAHRAQYEADFRAMAAALVPIQRPDGFWNESLINPMHCESIGKRGEDGPESTGTSLFAYGMAWGIRRGLLDHAVYAPVLVKAWNGLIRTALHPNGFLGWVQSTGAAPCDNTPTLGYDVTPNFEDYGVGCFLLAGSEVLQLAR